VYTNIHWDQGRSEVSEDKAAFLAETAFLIVEGSVLERQTR
jgi:hypothetical protein